MFVPVIHRSQTDTAKSVFINFANIPWHYRVAQKSKLLTQYNSLLFWATL